MLMPRRKAKTAETSSNIWYVDFPTYQYKEDVKSLAKERGLKLIDSRFDAGDGMANPPKLTRIGEDEYVNSEHDSGE